MTDDQTSDLDAALVDELDIIEEQPLAERAPMYARIHERLQDELGQ